MNRLFLFINELRMNNFGEVQLNLNLGIMSYLIIGLGCVLFTFLVRFLIKRLKNI